MCQQAVNPAVTVVKLRPVQRRDLMAFRKSVAPREVSLAPVAGNARPTWRPGQTLACTSVFGRRGVSATKGAPGAAAEDCKGPWRRRHSAMGEQVAIVWKGTAPISARGRESSCRALLLLRCCCLLAVVVDLMNIRMDIGVSSWLDDRRVKSRTRTEPLHVL
jgi:hypothetical protein